MERTVEDLDASDNLRFQRREWIVQRVAWAAALAVLAGALLGAFGRGPLGHARAADPKGLVAVRYQRIERQHAPSTLRVAIAPALLRAMAAFP